jgi:hypothetical protein
MPNTGYLNDENCLEPPPPDVGFQLHFGPDDYSNPDELSQFLLEPGGETLLCQYRHTTNTEDRYTSEQHTRLRSGTHHMIVWGTAVGAAAQAAGATDLQSTSQPDGTLQPDGCTSAFDHIFWTGAQAGLGPEGAVLDIPLPGDQDVPDSPSALGYARLTPAHASMNIDMHYVNTTDKPILMEGWINSIYIDPAKVTKTIDPIFFLGGLAMNVQPGTEQVVQSSDCEQPPGLTEPLRILGITGHAHSHTKRVSAYIDRADGTEELVYETYNWSDPINAEFDSAHSYPEPGTEGIDGAHNGELTMSPGDTFRFECDVLNDDLPTALHFANEAYTGEMCNIFGFYVPGNGGDWACFSN